MPAVQHMSYWRAGGCLLSTVGTVLVLFGFVSLALALVNFFGGGIKPFSMSLYLADNFLPLVGTAALPAGLLTVLKGIEMLRTQDRGVR